MTNRQQVIQRLLLAKSILAPYRFAPWGEPDSHTVAMQVLASHDAADLVFAALADHEGRLQNASNRAPSMVEVLDLLKFKGRAIEKPTTYFRDLNDVRNSLKHVGNLPNTKQWGRVGPDTYEKPSEACRACLDLSLDEIDESALLRDLEVRAHFITAKNAVDGQEYKQALEEIGKALCILFDVGTALGDISVGVAKAEDAIKLTGFGVHANDFLRLQEFLPRVSRLGDGPFTINWKQSQFGHPGNWRENAARFCLETFLQIAPRIQDTRWVPGAIEFWHFYSYKVTAIEDNVQIWEEVKSSYGINDPGLKTKRKTGELKKGESRTFSAIHQPLVLDWYDEDKEEFLKIVRLSDDSEGMYGLSPMRFVLFDKVRITCVPTSWAPEGNPTLEEIPWKPDDQAVEEEP